jgi:hypothetical protein
VVASNATDNPGVQIARTVLFAAGDAVQIMVTQSSGTTLNAMGNTGYNWVNITKVPAPVVNGAAASGVWGAAPLDAPSWATGTTDLMGREVYIDSKGQLRGKPDIIYLARPPTDLIATYPTGTTVMGVGSSDAAAMGWPPLSSCTVVTHRRSDTATGGQWCYLNSPTVSKAWYRSGGSAGWAPWVELTSGQGAWVDCSLEMRWCTDSSSVANAGSSVSARYMKVGKTVTLNVAGTVGSGAVTNFALLLPPSAGVPNPSTQYGPPVGLVGTGGTNVAGGWRTLSLDRIVFYESSGSYADSGASWSIRGMFIYEVA